MGRNKFDKDVLVCAVQEDLDGKSSQLAIAKRLGIYRGIACCYLKRTIPGLLIAALADTIEPKGNNFCKTNI